MSGRAAVVLALILLLFLFSRLALAQMAYYVDRVLRVDLDEDITQSTYQTLVSALEKAGENALVLITLNTYGGSADATLRIIQLFYSSSVPVMVYIPPAKFAWSAGTYILMAAHIASMAPSAVIGSCQPIMMEPYTGQIMPAPNKTVQAILAYLRTIAEVRNRNKTFAEACIKYNMNVNGVEAERYRIIDFVARDVGDAIRKVNGVEVLINDVKYVIILRNPRVERYSPSLGESLYKALSDPLLTYILINIGFLLVIAAVFTGHPVLAVVGILLIALSMLTSLPLNALALSLLIIGAILALADVLTGFSSHGIAAAIGGVFAGLGFLMIVPSIPAAQLRVDPVFIWLGAAINVGLLASVIGLMMYKALRTQLSRPISERLLAVVGKVGSAMDNIPSGGVGFVRVGGEIWRARALRDVKSGDPVVVKSVEGDILVVDKLSEENITQ